MNGFRFHAEMPEDRRSKSASKAHPFEPWTRATLKRLAAAGRHANVTAVYAGAEYGYTDGRTRMQEAVAAVYDWENSACATTSASMEYLRKRTVRIDEATARKLHPALFDYLDRPE